MTDGLPHETRSHGSQVPPPHGGEPVLVTPTREPPRAALILVHGRGADPTSILELALAHDVEGYRLLAPAAQGRTWYPHSFLAPTERNEPWLSSALASVASTVSMAEAEGIPAGRIVLMGFSQGACLASEFIRRHPRRYGGLVAYSGGLIGPPGTTWEEEDPGRRGTLADEDGATPAFLGCSDVDSHIPEERVHETARLLSALGAEVETRIYPGMGHTVNRDELRRAQRILDAARSLHGPPRSS